MRRQQTRALTIRYVSALLGVAGLLLAWQIAVQRSLSVQESDSRIINVAGRQRMLSQRLTMLLLALEVEAQGRRDNLTELARVADEWEHSQAALQRGLLGENSPSVQQELARIEGAHGSMLMAAHAAIAAGPGADLRSHVAAVRASQDLFLSGMDAIVVLYEQEAHARVISLRRAELALFVLALAVLALEGLLVFRPAVRGLRTYLAERDEALRALLDVSDYEQKRVAQELHDGLAQQLCAASFFVKTLRKKLGGGAHEERIEEIGRLLDESFEQTRALAHDLHAHVLEAEGIAAAFREFAAQTERVFGVSCRVENHLNLEVPLIMQRHLYQIGREAVLNAAKHAQATSIEIELLRDAAQLTLSIRDDGIGANTTRPDGMGSRLMKSRAQIIGATLEIVAREPRGTVVRCTAPHMTDVV
jgi:signal transduction histidine kinase